MGSMAYLGKNLGKPLENVRFVQFVTIELQSFDKLLDRSLGFERQ